MPTRGVTLRIIMMTLLSFITPISYLLSLWVFMGSYIDHRVTKVTTLSRSSGIFVLYVLIGGVTHSL